jgi:hypothetical protein
MSRTPVPHRNLIRPCVAAVAVLALLAACGDDDGPSEPSPGTTMPFVGGTEVPLDSTGGPDGSVLNNQPTGPAVDNAPPGSAGTG